MSLSIPLIRCIQSFTMIGCRVNARKNITKKQTHCRIYNVNSFRPQSPSCAFLRDKRYVSLHTDALRLMMMMSEILYVNAPKMCTKLFWTSELPAIRTVMCLSIFADDVILAGVWRHCLAIILNHKYTYPDLKIAENAQP